MKDTELEKLFSEFEPELSPTDRFMSQLERNLNAIEAVRLHALKERRRVRKIAIYSALIGMAAGCGLTLLARSAGLTVFAEMPPWISSVVYALIAGTSLALAMNATTLFRQLH